MNKFAGTSSLITEFDIILILLITIGIRNKRLLKTANLHQPNINIINENILNINKKGR